MLKHHVSCFSQNINFSFRISVHQIYRLSAELVIENKSEILGKVWFAREMYGLAVKLGEGRVGGRGGARRGGCLAGTGGRGGRRCGSRSRCR